MADIELVIKVNEKDFEFLKQSEGGRYSRTIIEAVINGIPLPKGHKRLIEDIFDVGPVFDEKGNRVGYRYVTQYDLDNAPTIIEADKAESEEEYGGI